MNVSSKAGLTAKLAVRTPEVLRSLREIITHLDGFVLQEDPDAERADVLILEIGGDPEAELKTIKALLEEGVVGTLFLTSARTSSDILLPALRSGAKEFFQQPIVAEEVQAAFRQVKSLGQGKTTVGDVQARQGKLIGVVGSKGGVGTTTFAVNLASTIQELDTEKSVALVDMNRLVGEVPLFLDLDTEVNWEEIGKNINRLDSAYLKSALVRHASGIYVMPAPYHIDGRTVQLPQDYLLQILTAMKGCFDYIVVDTGMYFDDMLFKILRRAETVFMVSTLSLPCVINVKRLRDILYRQMGAVNGKVRIVANRYEKKVQISLQEAGKIIGHEITDVIPNNYPLTMKAINSGKVLSEVNRRSDVARAYLRLAESVAEPREQKSSRWRFFN